MKDAQQQMDEIDDQLVALFKQRMSLAKEVAAQKYQHHESISNRGREADERVRLVKKLDDKQLASFLVDWLRDTTLITKQYQAHVIKDLQDAEN
ncbi:hypothetical protein IV38_GL001755 [Lactobacillus selangorensis]|uniref:Chorismate mutase domain-containing protein n=1 Tax=Lactobacillus selangorensis TaxID=81857 RepID=A0A0R2FS56_9LACO|nr:chorismate mutase [Lactobacillus selangorensis]KRN27916.1 hypothetical protein IV38_GL001755 [Lactobacillus selangorensis]KRN30613.1 hypothetical protein IV40_GL001800 [Lactobacillus selangorensis]